MKKKLASGGAQKKKNVSTKQLMPKGRKHFAATGKKATGIAAIADRDITKSINKRNEAIVSSKVVSSGSKFFLSDIRVTGQMEAEKQLRKREKRESKGSKNLDCRLREQLKSLGR